MKPHVPAPVAQQWEKAPDRADEGSHPAKNTQLITKNSGSRIAPDHSM